MRNNHLTTLGAHNYTEEDRETNDYYATDPVATYGLLDNFTFNNEIWEPACGEGAISEILKEKFIINKILILKITVLYIKKQDKLINLSCLFYLFLLSYVTLMQ